jgi:outer membrane protein OmpA-like peptidoglycan-associated protein
MRVRPFIALLCCAAASQAAFAQLNFREVKGAQDHPLLSRFEGSRLIGYNVIQYEQAEIPGSAPYFRNNELLVEKLLKPEGKYTRIAYVFAKDRSGLEVFRNYQAAIAKAGLKVVYTCEKDACGKLGSYYNSSYLMRDGFLTGSDFKNAFNSGMAEPRYVVAKGTQSDGTVVHVAVLVAPPLRENYGGVSLQIVEGKPMETDKVSTALNAGDMAKSLAAEGKVAVYGVYFDTDKTAVKPESKEALAEMAKLLQQDSKLKVHIVGHTDNQGSVAHNMDLSQKRAEAVVRMLTTDYRIDAKRLSAKGVGAYAPVASNDAEPGREKNRRVELVKQ